MRFDRLSQSATRVSVCGVVCGLEVIDPYTISNLPYCHCYTPEDLTWQRHSVYGQSSWCPATNVTGKCWNIHEFNDNSLSTSLNSSEFLERLLLNCFFDVSKHGPAKSDVGRHIGRSSTWKRCWKAPEIRHSCIPSPSSSRFCICWFPSVFRFANVSVTNRW